MSFTAGNYGNTALPRGTKLPCAGRSPAQGRQGVDHDEATVLLPARGADLHALLTYASRAATPAWRRAGRPGISRTRGRCSSRWTRLCRDRCALLHVATVPGRLEAAFLTPDEVLDIARRGAELGCKSAVHAGGPAEARWPAARGADAHGV